MVVVSQVIAWIVAVGIALIGARFLLQPAPSSAGFGVPADPKDAYLAVKGVRDIASGITLAVVLLTATHHVLGWFLLAACVTPVGDMLIVLRWGGARARAYGVHGATALVAAAAAVVLILS